MGAFVAEVGLRWSDMDAFGHVNHARTITLLEQARVQLLFTEATRQGLPGMAEGVVVARVAIDYHAPLGFDAGPLQIFLSVRDLRAASFVMDYSAYAHDATAVASAETLLVPYDVRGGRPRRLAEGERAFLAEWQVPAEREPNSA